MHELNTIIVQCPYCWENFETTADLSGTDLGGEPVQYTEDCYVCCRPILLTLELDQCGEVNYSAVAE